MDYLQLQDFFMVLMAICGCIVAISGAVAVVVKFWKWAHRQSDENAVTLSEIGTYLARDKRRIERLEKHQKETDEKLRLQLRALAMLLAHEVDGNHTEQLIELKDEIDAYLFKNY